MGEASKRRQQQKIENRAAKAAAMERIRTSERGGLMLTETVTQQQIEFSSGPIPSPSELAAYRDIDPKLVGAFVDAWTDESSHRRAMEVRALSADVDQVRWQANLARSGQIAGLAVNLALIVGGAVIAIWARSDVAQVLGSMMGGSTAVNLIWGYLRPAKAADEVPGEPSS